MAHLKPLNTYLPENITLQKNRELKLKQDREYQEAKESDTLRKIEEDTYQEWRKCVLDQHINGDVRVKIRSTSDNIILSFTKDKTINDLLEYLVAKYIETSDKNNKYNIMLRIHIDEYSSEFRCAYVDIPIENMTCYNLYIVEKEDL